MTRGRAIPSDVVEEVTHRYCLIGRSPLTSLTVQQGNLLSHELGIPVYVGMRNWKPYIRAATQQMTTDGIEHAVAICLAPQNSRTSVGLYRSVLFSDSEFPFTVDFVESWHDHPLLIKAFAEKLKSGWQPACAEAGAKVPVIFTAHSVPQRTSIVYFEIDCFCHVGTKDMSERKAYRQLRVVVGCVKVGCGNLITRTDCEAYPADKSEATHY